MTSATAIEQLSQETHNVGLDIVRRRAGEELGHPARANTLVRPEVLLQDPDGFLG